jgi:hypothetical protein
MRGLLVTGEGRRASARAVRWSPIVVPPTLGVVALAVLRLLGGSFWANRGMAAGPILALTAVAVAFVVDDPVVAAAPASPLGVRARLIGRAALVLPAAAAGWFSVWAIAQPLPSSLGRDGLAALALATAGTGAACVACSRWPHLSPGAVGAGAVVVAALVVDVAPSTWWAWVPSAVTAQLLLLGVGLVLAAYATAEPAR